MVGAILLTIFGALAAQKLLMIHRPRVKRFFAPFKKVKTSIQINGKRREF